MSDIVLSLGIDAGDAATGADAFMQQYARLKAAISDVTSARAASQQAVTQEAAATTTAAGAFEQEAQKRIQLNEMIKNMVIVRGQEQAAIDAAISRTGALNQVGDAAVGINQRFAASVAQLNAELTGGASAASSHADATTRMGSASTNAAAAQQGLSVGTAGVTREIIVLGREIASGDFSRIPGSLLVLTNRMGGLNLGTLGAVAAFGALAAAMAYPVIHAANMDQELRSLNAQLQITGNTAQVTAQQIMAMANAISPSTSASRLDIMGAAGKIASDNVIAPNLGVDQLQKLTDAAVSFAQVTGQQVAPATKTLTDALDGGVTSLAKLNEQFPIFTTAELQNLQAMGQHGQQAEALAIEIQKIDDYFHNAAQNGMSQTTKALNELGAAWTHLMDEMAQSGSVQGALKSFTSLANILASLGGSTSAASALDQSQMASLQTKIQTAMGQAGQGGVTGFVGGQMLDSLVQQEISLQAQMGARSAPAGISDLAGLMPSFSVAGGTTSSGPASGGDPRAAEHLANQQIVDDATLVAAAYQKTGVAQQLAIAQARDFAGAQDTVSQQEQSQAKFLADSIVIMAQHTAAIEASNRAVQQQVDDASALAEAWNKSTQAGVLAEAAQKALNVARQNDPTAATASKKQVDDQLSIAYDDLNAKAGQQLQILQAQRDASQALVDVAGNSELTTYTQITEQVLAQYANQLAIAEVEQERTGDGTDLAQVQDQITQSIQAQWDIHQNGLAVALKNELALSQDQLTAAQADLEAGSKKLATSKEEQAVQAEIVKLKQQGLDINSDDAQKILANVRATQQIKDEQQAITDQYRQQQEEVKKLADGITRDMSAGLVQVFQSGGSGWDKMIKSWHTSVDTFIANIISQFAETQIVLPIIESATGISASSTGTQGTGGVLSSLFSTASTGSSVSGLLGGPTIGSSLGITGNGGFLAGASAYLFGGAGATAGGSTVGAGTIGTLALSDGTVVPIVSQGAEIGAVSGGESAGLLGSGGASIAAIPGIGWMIAGTAASTYIGAEFGQANKSSSPIERYLEGDAIGGEVSGLSALFPYLFTGHPTVGPDSDAYSSFANGQLSVAGSASDNGGSVSDATKLLNDSISSLNSTTAALGLTINGLGNIEVGTFKGQYYVKQPGVGGGPGVGDYSSYATEDEAVIAYLKEALTSGSVTGLNANGQSALKNSTATDAATFEADLQFGQDFDAAINAMKSGVTDYTQAAETAAETTASQLTTSVENFNAKAKELGLDTQAAADATKSAVESFLGLTTSQPVSQLEQNVETLYGKLEGVSGLLSEVGISQADATEKVKEQVEQMLGITQAAPAMGTFATEMASIKQTFSDLAPIADKLGISAQDMATGLSNAEQQITQAANDNIQSQLDQLTGGIGTSLQSLVTTFQSTFADIQAVGGNLANAQELMALDIANLYKPEVQAAIQGVTTAYNNQITVEQNLASQSLKTSQDLATFLASMGAGSLSDGDPLSQLQAAKAAFDQAVQQSSSSDPTVAANAQGQLTSLAQQYLTASKSYNASGSGYVSDYDYVQQQLQEVEKSTADQASTATQQVTLLQQQLDAATGTQTNTLTIAQAVENLNTLMAQVNATIASSIASAGGGSYSGVVTPNGTSSTGVSYGVTPPPQPNMAAAINAIGQDYTSLLGRTGTQSDFAYYLNEVQNGVSLDQIATQFMNSPEYLAKHSHANGGLASGWSKVGERGEEWMYVPPSSGAMVYPHGTGGPSNDNGTTAVVQTLRAEMASLRQVVAQVGQQHAELLRVANGYAATQAHAADRAASRPR